MAIDPERRLLLAEGDLPGLVAMGLRAARPELARQTLVALPESEPGVAEVLRRQADRLGLETVASAATTGSQGLAGSLGLMTAAVEATLHGCGGLIWSAQAGLAEPAEHVDDIAGVLDRALLVSRLVALDSEAAGLTRPEFPVETPLADLSDRQVADLAVDLELPIETCPWWVDRRSGGHAAAARWMRALRAAGWAGLAEAAS
ncbi:MAG: hypothetical protein AAGG07_06685 [Planctomycetota bacterium]